MKASPISPANTNGCDGALPQVPGGVFWTDVARVAGDVDGDGYDDILIGDYYGDQLTRNRAVLFFGGCPPERVLELPGGNSRARSTPGLMGSNSRPSAGFAVAGTGDIDGDGFPDLAVSNPYLTGEGLGAGEVYLYRGGLNVSAIPTVILVHPDNPAGGGSDGFGFSVD